MAGELPGVPSTMTLPGHSSLCRRYSEVKHLLKELDRLIEAALERILQPTPGNGSENVSPPLDLELWNQIPLVLIDEHDKDNPIILDIFETNQAAGGNETATGNKTSVSNDTAEDYQSSTTTGNEATTPPALANTTTGNETTAPPAPANTTSEEKKYKLAVKLVRGPTVAAGRDEGWVPRQGYSWEIRDSSPPAAHGHSALGLWSGCAQT